MFDPITPQLDPEQLFLLGRYYTSQKGNPSYRKRVTWVDQKRSDIPVLAVCKYIGASQVSQAHGNTNHSVQIPYLRTPVATMERVSQGVSNGVSCKQVYDTIVGDTVGLASMPSEFN